MLELADAPIAETRVARRVWPATRTCDVLFAALDLDSEHDIGFEIQATLQSEAADSAELRALYAQLLLRRGDPDRALVESEQAADDEETCITLYSHGRALAAKDPEAGLAVLERAFRLAEQSHQSFWAASAGHGLAAARFDLGQYVSAADWAEWSMRIYRREGLDHPPLMVQLLAQHALALSLGGGDLATPAQLLRSEIDTLDGVQASLIVRLRTDLAEVLLMHGQADDALSICQSAWDTSARRADLAQMACVYVQAALAAGRADRAVAAAERVMELTRGLHRIYRRWAMLACGIAFATVQPARARLMLGAALDDFRAPLVAPRVAQASMYLALALLNSGDAAAARAALDDASGALAGVNQRGIAGLCPDERARSAVLALRRHEVASLELRFLGRAEARLGTQVIALRLRFAEILACLARRPDGLTLEQLALEVYGEDASLTLCKTEVSRLRRILPIGNRPYRLGVAVTADFLELRGLLRDGRLRDALGLYQGSLLPRSDAPLINAQREDLDVALREAVLASPDPEAAWLLAERMPDDLEVWEQASARLPRDDPRRFLARARVARLARDWNDDDDDDV
ncbi:MAG: hypothetical protein M3069_32445 [Chloroflexota bacterium]|nr:hypothetical protein [Chloroflexota bacterium]